MNKGHVVIAFLVGAAVGAVSAWKWLEYKNRKEQEESVIYVEDEQNCEEEAYQAIVNENYNTEQTDREEGPEVKDKPYVIAPEEFGDGEYDYDLVSLTLYADGVLEDPNGDIIEDVEGTVGVDSLDHFGEYEDDSVFVRNDRLKTEYEILKDLRTSAEARPGAFE